MGENRNPAGRKSGLYVAAGAYNCNPGTERLDSDRDRDVAAGTCYSAAPADICGEKSWRFGFGLVAVLVLGVIGRWDGVAGLTILFLICIAGICRKCWEYPVIGVLGTGLAYPTYLAWKHWIFDGSFAESGFEYTSIMNMGYSIGGLFSTYFHRGGNPGMGILLFGCQIFYGMLLL